MDNLPPGVSGYEPEIFGGKDQAPFDYDEAVAWIEGDKLDDDFSEYVAGHFPSIMGLFRKHLHPENSVLNNDELVDDNQELFDTFLWTVLDEARRKVLVEAFTEAHWDDYQEYVT